MFLNHIRFDPPPIPYGDGKVNTPESKPLVLENCSECDVKYKLFYIANKEPPLRQSSKGERVAIVGHCDSTENLFSAPVKTLPST